MSKFASDIRRWLSAATKLKLWIGRSIDVETKPLWLARSVVGHVLAAEERKDPWTIPPEGTSTRALKDFFLNEGSPWPSDMHLYVWLYPAPAQIIVRGFAISGVLEPHRYGPIVGDVLKFFPVAFWLTAGSAAGSHHNLTALPLSGNEEQSSDTLSMTLRGYPHVRWPEQPRDHEIVLMNDDRTSVATASSSPSP